MMSNILKVSFKINSMYRSGSSFLFFNIVGANMLSVYTKFITNNQATNR